MGTGTASCGASPHSFGAPSNLENFDDAKSPVALGGAASFSRVGRRPGARRPQEFPRSVAGIAHHGSRFSRSRDLSRRQSSSLGGSHSKQRWSPFFPHGHL